MPRYNGFSKIPLQLSGIFDEIVYSSVRELTLSHLSQDGRADVVANDAGDRVTPAIVAYSEREQVPSSTLIGCSLKTTKSLDYC